MDKTTEKDRIDELIQAVMKVAKGDYSAYVELSENNDELDSLAMGLNMMVDDIRTSVERVEKAHEMRIKSESAAAADRGRAELAERFAKELETKVKALEDFHDLAVGRELKMKKMEKEMEELKRMSEEKGK